ncbi:hypothetical protein [Boseongicola sp. H5]|nr:hypothetical protein [Boseongicola sp. H5]
MLGAFPLMAIPFPGIVPLELFSRDLAANQARQTKHGVIRCKGCI